MGQVTIASIYPLTVGITRPRFIPTSEMWIYGFEQGASPDAIKERVRNPELKVIVDQTEHNKAPISGIEITNTFSADEVARDFIKHATQDSPGMGPDCHPGVWICQGAEPSQTEINLYRAIQSRYFANRLEFANGLATDPQTRKAITWLMRVSAMALGREPEWLNPPSDLDVTECPYCRKNVPVNAATCSSCSNVVNVELYARLEKQKKDAMKALTAA